MLYQEQRNFIRKIIKVIITYLGWFFINHKEIQIKGLNIEKQVAFLLGKSAKLTAENAIYDIDYKGQQIEVKSAELRIKDGKSNGTRWGRFQICKESHEKLKENNGCYALAVTFEEKIILLKFIKAADVRFVVSNFTSMRPCISFNALYKGIFLKEFKELIDLKGVLF